MRGQAVAFPDTYAGYEVEPLLAAYAAGPDRVAAVIHGLDARAMRARPRPGKWSIQEIVLHVADSELMGAGRVRLASAQPGAPLVGYDQAVFAERLAYQARDAHAVRDALELFRLLRRTTLPLFTRAPGDEWARWYGIHPEYGPVTLRNLLELYADHSERHIEQILAIRQLLDVPLAFELLLPQRLY